MRSIARFVVDTHCHISTMYQPATKEGWEMVEKGEWTGLVEELEPFDNSDFTVRDMDRYGVDMAILLPSITGTLNETQLKIVKKYPDRFRSCCSDQTTCLNAKRGKEPWSFKASIKEVEKALRTGNFVGVGEFTPGSFARSIQLPGAEGPVSFEKRLDEWNALCELVIKYDVPLYCHDGFIRQKEGNWTVKDLLIKVCEANPDAKVVLAHGGGGRNEDEMRETYAAYGSLDNLTLETGGWYAGQFEIAFEAGVTANHLMWGHDYGNVPQYIVRKNIGQWGPMPESLEDRNTMSKMMFGYKNWPAVPTYQPDFYGWGMRTVDRVGDWLTQDEINLIMGGTAAKLFKLPVPYPRMFPEGRPDIFGDKWEESIPYLPDEQIENPENVRMSKSPFTGQW